MATWNLVNADVPILARSAISAEPTCSILDFGAVCDGVTNDATALQQALSYLSDIGGGVLVLPPKSIAITLDTVSLDANSAQVPQFDIPANTRIVGTPGATTILLDTSTPAAFYGFLGSAGDNVTIEGVTMRRVADASMIFCSPGAYSGFHLRDCVLDGQQGTLSATNIMHGISLNRAGTKTNLTLKGCTVTGVNFGLLQDNSVTDTVSGVVVDDCTFHDNYRDDLSFNAPVSSMSDVRVINSRFTDNQSTTTVGGYGVSFAHVDNFVVRDCRFTNYFNEGIHLEDYCTNGVIAGNRLITCGQCDGETVTDLDRCSIFVATGSSDVVVTGNLCDHTANENTNGLHGIVVKNLTGAETYGGHPMIPPLRVTVSDNIIQCGENFGGIWVAHVKGAVVKGNQVIGAGAVDTGVWDDANTRFGIKMDGIKTVIADNTVSGFRYGISGPLETDSTGDWTARKSLGNPGTVTGNLVSDCYIGMMAVPAGALNMSGNQMNNCVRPLVVGENQYAAEPCMVTNNVDLDCVYPQEVGGTCVVVVPSGADTVTVGAGKTVYVNDTVMTLAGRFGAAGVVITFSGGGVLTTTTAITSSQHYDPGTPYALAGTVSGASITADEWGIVHGLDSTQDLAGTSIIQAENSIAGGESTLPRTALTSSASLTSADVLRLTYFTSRKTFTANRIRTMCGTTAAVTPSMCRIGVYDVDSIGTIRLIASTANDTALWGTINTPYTKSFSAPVTLYAGQRYAVGILVRGAATYPTLVGVQGGSGFANEFAIEPRIGGYVGSASDLPNPATAAAIGASSSLHYAVLLP